MKSDHRVFDDMSKMMAGLFSGVDSLRSEVERDFKTKLQNLLNSDLVGRDEFEAYRQMLQEIKSQQQDIIDRLDRLEAVHLEGGAKIMPTGSKPAIKKPVVKKSAAKKP